MKIENKITEINNRFKSDEHYIKEEIKHIKDHNSEDELRIVTTRILNNIDPHDENSDGVEMMFNYLNNIDKTYSISLKDEVEILLLSWITSVRDNLILQVEN